MIGKLPEHLSSPNSTRVLTPQGSGSGTPPGGAAPQHAFSTTPGQDAKNALLDAKPAVLGDVAVKLPILEKRAAVEAPEERGEGDFQIKATPRGGADGNSHPNAASQAAPAEQATPRRSSTTDSKKAEAHVQAKPTPRRSSASSAHNEEAAAAATKPATKATPRRSIPSAHAKEAASTGTQPTASPHRTPRASAAEAAAAQGPAKATATPRRTPRSSQAEEVAAQAPAKATATPRRTPRSSQAEEVAAQVPAKATATPRRTPRASAAEEAAAQVPAKATATPRRTPRTSQAEEVAAKPAAGKPTPTPRRRSGTATITSAAADAAAPAASAAQQHKAIPRPLAAAAASGAKKAAAPAVPKQQQGQQEEAALPAPVPTEAPAVVTAEQQPQQEAVAAQEPPAAASAEPQQEAAAAPERAVTVEPVVLQQEVAAAAVEAQPEQVQVLATAAQEALAASAGKPSMFAELVPKPDGSVELRINASSSLYQQAVAAAAASASASQAAPAAAATPAAVAAAVEEAPADVEVPLGGAEQAAVDAAAAAPRTKGNRLLRFFSSKKTRQQGTPADGQLVPLVAQQGWRSLSFRAQLARSLKALGKSFTFRRSVKRKDSPPIPLFRRLSNSMRRKGSSSGQLVVLMEDGGPMWSGMPLEPVAETSREGSASSSAVAEMPRTPHAMPHTSCCKASCPGCGAGLIVEVRADSSPVLRLDGPFKPPRRVPVATAGVRMSCWAVLS